MAGLTPLVKFEDEVLRKYYRSFHKHGATNWAKVSKDTKLSAEQCEMLHKQHMSFLSLPPSPALETAFLAMVDDHYNATQAKLMKDELKVDDLAYGGRPRRGEPEDEAQVATSSSQKPRRTPKPTPQRLAAEEEQAARRLAKANQATPKSAKAKMPGKAPPSPPPGEWTSSQRKRSRRLFEDGGEPDGPRYRSPVIDRWRGRHNTDVDEGVDALLSLASGAHASGAIDERPTGTDMASNTADRDYELAEPDTLEETPKRARGTRGARTTPTPSGTPVKASGRSSSAAAAATAAAADAVPVPNATGLRSPRTRGGGSSSVAAAAGAAAPAATTSGRAGAASGGRPKKETLGSPTKSQQRAGAAAGTGSAAAAAVITAEEGSDGGAAPAQGNEGAPGAGNSSTPDAGAAATAAAASPGPSGRPVRMRKPTAIARAAAAAAEEEDGVSARGVRSVVAAVAAAVAAAEASQATAVATVPAVTQPETSAASPDTDTTPAADLATNTAALLASVPPVRTRASARLANGGSGSRRAGERPSPQIGGAESGGKEARASSDAEPAAEAAPSTEPPVAVAGRGKGAASAGLSQTAAQPTVPPAVRFGPAPVPVHPPPGRTRRRKSLPERLPPFWQPVKLVTPRTGGGARGGSKAQAAGAEAASGEAAAMPDAEKALRRCLTGPRLRRWCMYEFHYSALDRPWFVRNELLEFCVLHMQLPTTKLTRLEWSVLRAALGRPRRLSLAFLREERLRLEGYREHARLKYEEVNLGLEVPPELPRQLRVGQEVVAPHPYSRQLYDGVILTVKGSNYRVQFHRGELMTELIRDTDVMPVDPHECMPISMAVMPVMLNGRVYDPVRLATARGLLPPPGIGLRPPVLPPRPLGSYATGLDTQMMREQEAAMVAEVQRALEVKEELVAQLAQLNNEAASGLHTDENGGRTDNFQLKYTNVVLKLRDTNAVLEAALNRLQARQQQILAAPPAALGPMLALQQQQQQLAAAAAAGAVGGAAAAPTPAGSVARPPVPAAAGAPVLPQPPQRQVLTQAPVLTQAQSQTLPQAVPQTPPSQQAQPQPLPSPTSSASALPLVPPAAPATLAAAAPSAPPTGAGPPAGQQGRVAATKPPVPPPSPTATLIVPQARPSSASGSGAATASAAAPAAVPLVTHGAPTPSGLTQPASTPAQLVEQALSEARTVVDGCRGRGTDGQPLLLPAPPQPVPVVAPIILQSHGGTSLPLVLPPGAVLPQQLVPQQQGVAEGQPIEHGASLSGVSVPAPAQPAHVTPTDGEGSSEERTTAGGLAECSGGGTVRGGSADAAEMCASGSVHVKTEDEGVQGRGCSEMTCSADRAADGRPPGGRPRAEQHCVTEEELAESWLRDVIVGCVGVLFTIQKCTAGNVPATTVAEALDLAVQQLRIRTEGENDALYGDIVQSVQGLKGHLTRAFA